MARTMLHEALGHYVQAALDRQAPTTMQKVALSPLFIEGWAAYVEEMMLAEGWMPGDAQACAWRRRAPRCCARRAWWPRCACTRSAPSSTTRPRCSPTRPGSTTCRRGARRSARRSIRWCSATRSGRIAIVKLRDDWRAAHVGAPLGAFHDALLRHGTPSPICLRKVLLPGDTASPLIWWTGRAP